MASRSHCAHQWNRKEESQKHRAGEAYDLRADDSADLVSVSFRLGVAVLVRHFIFVEQFRHFFGHHISIIGD